MRVKATAFPAAVQDVCSAGNTEACERVKFTEAGRFAGGLAGGWASGIVLSAPVVGGLCVGLGGYTRGLSVLACGVLVVGGATFSAGQAGEKVGENIAEKIYELVK